MFENSFALGFDFAANRYGLSKNQLMIKMAAENEIVDDPAIQKLYSTVGAYILKKAGLQNSVEFQKNVQDTMHQCLNTPDKHSLNL